MVKYLLHKRFYMKDHYKQCLQCMYNILMFTELLYTSIFFIAVCILCVQLY